MSAVPDGAVWREVGEPLLGGASSGPLLGETVAVKDLYAVEGHRTGAGNPSWLADSPVAVRSASVVQALLDAGAVVRGLSQTDELAYSLAGTNAHSGTPINPRAPGRISGGSSSGSASAVSLGEASIGLGTDTGGSIRVPASYQGLFGIRTTHDLVPRDGLVPLAASFDTVGWMTRDVATLRRVGDVLLPPAGPAGTHHLVLVPALIDLAETDVAAAIGAWTYGRSVTNETWDLHDLAQWRAAFQTWQGYQAWAAHGDWLTDRLDVLGPDVRGRFAHASTITADQADTAYGVLEVAREMILGLVGEHVLVLPSASSVAPLPGEAVQTIREATLNLTCIAGIGGLPAVSVPLQTAAGLPCGVCLVAAPGRDRDLLELAAALRD